MFYSGGSRFECRLEQRLSWIYVIFLSHFRQVPVLQHYCLLSRHFRLIFRSLFFRLLYVQTSHIGNVLNEPKKIDFTSLSSAHISCPPLSTITGSNWRACHRYTQIFPSLSSQWLLLFLQFRLVFTSALLAELLNVRSSKYFKFDVILTVHRR